MKWKVIFLGTCLLFSRTVDGRSDLFNVTSVTSKVLMIGAKTGNSNSLVIHTAKGLVFVDSFWSPDAAREALDLAAGVFGTRKLAYLINTNSSMLSIGGGGLFSGLIRIGHHDLNARLRERREKWGEILEDRGEEFHQRVVRGNEQLTKVAAESPRAEKLRNWIGLCGRVSHDLKKGYTLAVPNLLYSDRLSLDMGDTTIEVFYFGTTAGGGDSVVRIPEEGVVFLGDLFHAYHVLPYGSYTHVAPGVDRWISTLELLLGDGANVRHWLRANSVAPWSETHVAARLRLIRDVRDKVRKVTSANPDWELLKPGFLPASKVFPYTADWKDTMPDLVDYDVEILAKALIRQGKGDR